MWVIDIAEKYNSCNRVRNNIISHRQFITEDELKKKCFRNTFQVAHRINAALLLLVYLSVFECCFEHPFFRGEKYI